MQKQSRRGREENFSVLLPPGVHFIVQHLPAQSGTSDNVKTVCTHQLRGMSENRKTMFIYFAYLFLTNSYYDHMTMNKL